MIALPTTSRRLVPLLLVLFGLASAGPGAFGDDELEPLVDGPTELVHLPTDELDVLLQTDRQGIVLRYAEYERLLAAAKARAKLLAGEPPVDGALSAARGSIDLTGEKAGRLTLEYDVRILADGPRAVSFPLRNIAIEELVLEPEEGVSGGRYEERDGKPRLRFEGAGARTVRVDASAAYARKGERRFLDLGLPPASAMFVTVRVPAGMEGALIGEGPGIRIRPNDQAQVVRVRPGRDGRLRVAWAPAAKGVDGPSILDTQVYELHDLADGIVKSSIVVQTDVFRTAAPGLTLRVPADFAVQGLEGKGVTGFRRSDDRTRLSVDLAQPVLGRIELKLDGERPYRPGPGVVPPHVRVDDAVRHRAQMALRFGRDVKVHAISVQGGRRLPASRTEAGVLRYALAGADATLGVDLEPGAIRLDARSTYYLNLAEAGKTLLATTTYRVVEGTIFSLQPRFPVGFELVDLTVNGRTDGFERDLRDDGSLEIRLARGVPKGAEIALAATFEQARAEWLGDGASVRVPLRVPSAGATREDGLVAVGADAAFRVLEVADSRTDLVAVGAGELTSRGISAAGLVYGYRLDGKDPALALDVERRTPLLDAAVVTTVTPSVRRLDARAVVIHQIRRAGVRRLFVDVPSWAGETVDIQSPHLRASFRLAGTQQPADVPDGFDRWQVDLSERVIGRHALRVAYHEDQDRADWSLPADRALGVRVPLQRSERSLVVERAEGLEVRVDTDAPGVRTLDVTELPLEAAVDPLKVREVLRLANGTDSVPISVRKHDGAAVLDAIATQVALRTAVASEGILRTRAEVTLFNVDRQFLQVRLPAGSALLGAVVDAKPVKPLVQDDGTLLIPIPTARARDARTLAALTYETRLEAEVSGTVRVPGPELPNLEVLHTTHVVAFEPGLEIHEVSGSFAERALTVPSAHRPWLIATFENLQPVTLSALQREDYDAESTISSAAELVPSNFEPPPVAERPVPEADPREDPTRGPGQKPAGPPAPKRPARGAQPTAATTPAADAGAPAAEPPAPGGDGPGAGEGGGEGGASPFRPQPTPRGARFGRRKGRLSLDVPVLLAPNQVMAQRLGTGGTLDILVVRSSTRDKRYYALVLLFVAAGIGVGLGHRLRAALFVAGAVALAALAHALLGRTAGTFVSALADAATILVAIYLARALARWIFGAGKSAPAATAAGILLALALAAPATAHADEPRPPVPNATGADPIYVPYDPAKPEEIDKDDRVFLPLETYLRLHKAAHPDQDPEVVALGRYVTLIDARYRLDVGDEMAVGSATFRFAKRGDGLMLVGLPLAGVAVTGAKLDGQPVQLLLDKALYRVPLTTEGDHLLELSCRVPLVTDGGGRHFGYEAPRFGGATLDIVDPDFAGETQVSGAGRVEIRGLAGRGDGYLARAYLGRARKIRVSLLEPKADELPRTVVMRSEVRTIHSLRRDGTESASDLVVHVLQGRVPFVDLELPPGHTLLEARGPQVLRWEARPDRPRVVRLLFEGATSGRIPLSVRTFLAAKDPERSETLVGPTVVDTTSERGSVIVNADETLRIELGGERGLHRTGRPQHEQARGHDGAGRVVGAWTFAARPAALDLRVEMAEPRIELSSEIAAVFGDDHVRTRLDATVRVDRTHVGGLTFALPGLDEVREVESPGLDTWWVSGEGETRRLFLRYADLRQGVFGVRVFLERRLGGTRSGIDVPRWSLEGARRDRGRLVLYKLPDVDLSPGVLPGLRSVPTLRRPNGGHFDGAKIVQAYTWEAPLAGSLPVGLRTPDLARRAVLVSMIAPGDEEHRIEHLVLFDVTRGSTDQLTLFVPDGGHALYDVVRTRDMRELRGEAVTRTGADGQEVKGTLYDVRLQSPRGGLIELTVSQVWEAARPVRQIQPEGVSETRWFGLVRTFLDGQVAAGPIAGKPEQADWSDLPFVPTGLDRSGVVRVFVATEPYVLRVIADRRPIESQAAAVVLLAVADVALGMDGQARIRTSYRLFNRGRQFLRLALPQDAVLYGATAAGDVIKPLRGAQGTVLLPIPKVPLGGTGYTVSITYRTRAGLDFDEGETLRVLLPEIVATEVDRTVVRLYVPEGYDYDFDTPMNATGESDVAADLAEVALREVRDLLKVTETGTLDQRVLSCGNAGLLIDEARRLQGEAMAAGVGLQLGQEIAQVSEQWQACKVVVDQDLQAARGQALAINPSQEFIGGNAVNFVAKLDDVTNGTRDEAAARALNMFSNKAGWVFNDAEPQEGRASKQDIATLKGDIETKLRSQQREVSRKLLEAIEPEEQAKQAAQSVESLLTRHKATSDTKNIGELNRRLRADQLAKNQLGAMAVPQSGSQAGQMGQAGEQLDETRTFAGRYSRAALARDQGADQRRQADALLGYSNIYNSQFAAEDTGVDFRALGKEGAHAGVFFNDGQDGAFRARTENVFDRELVEGKTGLMGVNVPLPRFGRVFYFRSLRAGSPIEIEATKASISQGGRILLLLLIVAAVAAVGTAFARKRRTAAA